MGFDRIQGLVSHDVYHLAASCGWIYTSVGTTGSAMVPLSLCVRSQSILLLCLTHTLAMTLNLAVLKILAQEEASLAYLDQLLFYIDGWPGQTSPAPPF